MLRSEHRGLRNRDLKLGWVGGGCVGVQGKGRDSLALVNIFAFKLIWDHIKINMFNQIKLEAKILFRM